MKTSLILNLPVSIAAVIEQIASEEHVTPARVILNMVRECVGRNMKANLVAAADAPPVIPSGWSAPIKGAKPQ